MFIILTKENLSFQGLMYILCTSVISLLYCFAEQRDAKLRKKQLEQQLKNEDAMAAALRVWNTEVLTNWEAM